MSNGLSRGLNALVGRAVPERTVFVRGAGRTRFVCLAPLTQLGAAAAVAAAIGWTGYASTAVLSRALDGAGGEARIEALKSAHAARIEALEAERRSLAAERARLRERVAALQGELDARQSDLLARGRALEEAENARAALGERVETLEAERAAAEARVEELEATVFADGAPLAAPRLAAGPRVENLGGGVSDAMADVIAERDRALREARALDTRLDSAETELAAWADREEEVLSRLEEAARTSLDGMSELFDRAELDLDRILAETRRDYSGQGGPFAPIAPGALADGGTGPGADARVAALVTDLERVHLMRLAVERLPFAAPVRGARLTSGFGKRRDPFNGGWAMHSGIDYAAPRGTPIRAGAGGIVEFAGWMRGYGKVVRIRHAFGFQTRYAHLSRLAVSPGDQVSRGDVIGSMGSTGRSTGSHLHYEVRVDDEPVDPAKFIEAARDVL